MGNRTTNLIFKGARKGVKGLRIQFVRRGREEGREGQGHLSSRNFKALCK